MSAGLRVGLARDILTSSGEPSFGREPLAVLDKGPALDWNYLDGAGPEITPELTASYDALYVNAQRVGASALTGIEPRVRIVARHGVGYDSVDLPAMTKAGIIVTNTPVAVRRPVATMTMTFVLALAQKLFAKDRLTRTGRWNERTDYMGQGLTGRVLGLVGAGGIGREIIPLAKAFDMQVLAADPYADSGEIARIGAELVPLDSLLERADFIVVICLLNEETRHLINAARLARMKPEAYLINVARGPIVDEKALIEALSSDRIAGAALDVFEQEPVDPANPLLKMDNVIVTPHALCWTDECFSAIATSGLTSIVQMLSRQTPQHIVNREVLDHPRVKEWLNL